jgi:hypothetical protein
MASPFDHVNTIYTDQSIDYFDSLEEKEKKNFNPYMINRIISMNPDYLPVVNEFQKYYGIVGGRETYLFFSQLLPKKKQFNKYVKGSKEALYEPWLVDVVIRYYKVSKSEANYYLSLCYQTEAGRENLKSICSKYGIDPKLFKKAKL